MRTRQPSRSRRLRPDAEAPPEAGGLPLTRMWAARLRAGEFWRDRGISVGDTSALGRAVGRSGWGGAEAEIGSPMVGKAAESGVEMADAESLPSRRRVVTAGLADSLPIARLPSFVS